MAREPAGIASYSLILGKSSVTIRTTFRVSWYDFWGVDVLHSVCSGCAADLRPSNSSYNLYAVHDGSAFAQNITGSTTAITMCVLSVMHVWVLVARDDCANEPLLEDGLLGEGGSRDSMSPLQKAYFCLSEANVKGTFFGMRAPTNS